MSSGEAGVSACASGNPHRVWGSQCLLASHAPGFLDFWCVSCSGLPGSAALVIPSASGGNVVGVPAAQQRDEAEACARVKKGL